MSGYTCTYLTYLTLPETADGEILVDIYPFVSDIFLNE